MRCNINRLTFAVQIFFKTLVDMEQNLSSLEGKYPALMLQRAWRWSRAQREKGRPEVGPGVVLLSDSFEYLPTARHPGGRAKDISLGFFWIVPAAQAENKTKREIN